MIEKPKNWEEMGLFDKQEWCLQNGFVECDENCMALEKPETLEEHIATLEHYKHHSYLSGCSHGS